MKFKKGDHVEWKNKDNFIEYDIVQKGGSKWILVVKLGGKYEVAGPAACFRPSSFVIPQDLDNPMVRWGGPNLYTSLPNSPKNIEYCLRAEAKVWAQYYGWKDPIEAEDCWLYWAAKLQPYGMPPKEYINNEIPV